MEQSLIGKNAGVIYTALQGKGNVEISKLKKETKLSEAELWAAIGWLSREDKLVCSTEKKARKTLVCYALKD